MWKDRREKFFIPLYRSVVSGLLHVQPFCGSSTELEKLEGGDEQRYSFLGDRRLDRLCVSEKREVRGDTGDQQLVAEMEVTGE